MTKAELINVVAQKTELSKKDSEKAVVAVIDAISEALPSCLLSKQAKLSKRLFPSNLESTKNTFNSSGASGAVVVSAEVRTGGITMRLDKYLKITRLIKRRTVANEACDGGRILVNGKVARASYAVKEGDTIEIQMGNRPLKVQVLSVSEYATKESAPEMYRVEE